MRKPDVVAKELLGKIIMFRGKKARIVETEAYFDEKDPASRASKGENKVHKMMKEEAGKILVYNVHKYKMLNFVCEKKNKAGAVLIRALEPLNFKGRCNGPGLLTECLGISDVLHGKFINKKGSIYVFNDNFNVEDSKIERDFRIGVVEDLEEPLRFFIKGNNHVSRKAYNKRL